MLPSTALAIRLFGGFEARVDGEPIGRVRSRSVEWLLALLVLRQGRDVPRVWLSGVLWPESTQELALFNLRRNLMDLRRVLGPAAERLRSPTRDSLLLDLSAAEADLVAFDRTTDAGDDASLAQAVALYRGPLLEGWTEEWVIPEREQRTTACLQALETLAARAAERGERGEAEEYLRQAAAIDPLRDVTQRRLMELLADRGDIPAAILIFREYRLRLHQEMGVEPDPETIQLFRELRSGVRRTLLRRERAGAALPGGEVTANGHSPAAPADPLPLLSSDPPMPPATASVGDEEAVGEIVSALTASHPISPVGAAGVGGKPVDGEPASSEREGDAPRYDVPSGTVTFLFADIEDSALLWERHPDAMRCAFDRHVGQLRAAIASHGGCLFKTVGDTVWAVFTRPDAALDAALTTQQGLAAAAPETVVAGRPLRARMALHTGAAEAREGEYLGPAVNRAQRLLEAGHGGQVLLSRATQELVQDDLPADAALRDLGPHRLRDLQRPEHAFQLLHPDLPAAFPTLKSLDTLSTNLTQQVTSFIGREQEIAEVKRLLATTRLLTLTGAGGTGKTRLALQVAAELLLGDADGVWVAELAAVTDPELVPQVVATALGVREQPGKPVQRPVVEFLKPKKLLLVLDNCEHVLAGCAQLADTLLRHCPQVVLLATSREALGIAGEQTFWVPSLSLPEDPGVRAFGRSGVQADPADPSAPSDRSDPERLNARTPERLTLPERLLQYEAVRLFIDRARSIASTFTLTPENAPAVAQICRRLDGIPLAIELAAARAKVLTVEQIAARLDDRFRLLTGGSRTALPRQRTLRALIDWSYDLLTEPERALLLRLSVFAGGFTLEAAEAVCSGVQVFGCSGVQVDSSSQPEHLNTRTPEHLPLEAWEVLDLLTALIEKSLVVAEPQAGEQRYRLIETVREYSRGRLQELGQGETFRRRHGDFFRALAEEADRKLRGPQQVAWMQRLEVEHDNLRAALEWAQSAPAGRLTGLRLAGSLWWFWHQRGHLSEARAWLEGALAGDARGEEQPPATAEAFPETPLLRTARAWALQGAGAMAWMQCDYPQARAWLEESLAIGRERDDKPISAMALNVLGWVVLEQGDHAGARACYEESVALFREAEDRWGRALSLFCLGNMANVQGDDAAARSRYTESLALFRQLGDKWGITRPLHGLGTLSYRQGEYAAARALYEESLALRRELGDKRGIAAPMCSLAYVAYQQGDYGRAEALFAESLALHREQRNGLGIAECLEGLAGVAAAPGREESGWDGACRVERAARILGAVEAARAALGAPLTPAERAQHERHVADLQAQLSAEALAAAWAEGRAMTSEQATAEALAGCVRGAEVAMSSS